MTNAMLLAVMRDNKFEQNWLTVLDVAEQIVSTKAAELKSYGAGPL